MLDSNAESVRETTATGAARTGGAKSKLDEYARGKLLIALASGLTQREAAIWVGATQSNVHYLLDKPEFTQELRRYTEFARLHPRLRMYQAAGGSWRAAARLLGEFDQRNEPLTTDELIDGMSLMLDQVNAATRKEEY